MKKKNLSQRIKEIEETLDLLMREHYEIVKIMKAIKKELMRIK